LALYETDQLEKALLKIFSESDLLLLYDKKNSFMWDHRKEIMGALDHVKTKNMFYKSKTLDQYMEYNEMKNEIIKLKKSKSLKLEEKKVFKKENDLISEQCLPKLQKSKTMIQKGDSEMKGSLNLENICEE